MASAAARHFPGAKAVFIRGIRLVWSSRPAAGAASCFGASRGSRGFSASAGMAQDFPNFRAPGTRPAMQNCCTSRGEMFHFSAVSRTVRYFHGRAPPETVF